MDAEETALFGAFDDAPSQLPAPAAATRATHDLPPAFAHLKHEAIASIAMHSIADDDRQKLERVLRECKVAEQEHTSTPPPDRQECALGIATSDAVHYFRE